MTELYVLRHKKYKEYYLDCSNSKRPQISVVSKAVRSTESDLRCEYTAALEHCAKRVNDPYSTVLRWRRIQVPIETLGFALNEAIDIHDFEIVTFREVEE